MGGISESRRHADPAGIDFGAGTPDLAAHGAGTFVIWVWRTPLVRTMTSHVLLYGDSQAYLEWVNEFDTLNERGRESIRKVAAKMMPRPAFALVLLG